MSYIPLKYEFETGISAKLKPCPGFYCGRSKLLDGNYSACGSCPRGFKTNQYSECVECNDELILYDWLYLGFMALLPLLLHFSSIENKVLRSSRNTLILVICSIVEVGVAGAITLFLWDPVGSLQLRACRTNDLADWYPIFYNPQPNYEATLHCAHEAVYPLYTVVLVFYAVADFLMLFVRVGVSFLKVKVAKSIYAGLYFFPILAFMHLVLGGVLYYAFPFITIIISVISCAYNFSKRKNQDIRSLCVESVTDWRNVGIILCHWFLHGYGIISITELKNPQQDWCFLGLIPLPALLYILTVNFTDPDKNAYFVSSSFN